MQSPCGAPVSVLKTQLRAFSYLIDSETFSSLEMIRSSSASMVFRRSSISLFLLMQSNAVLLSSVIRCTGSFLAMMVVSIISLEVKICSVVDRFGL